ncbi:MAG: hypothetical protein HUU38_11260 [Anaerolineales bacterium]|nr:hypothetical protein [Anaerolineales bacterium]
MLIGCVPAQTVEPTPTVPPPPTLTSIPPTSSPTSTEPPTPTLTLTPTAPPTRTPRPTAIPLFSPVKSAPIIPVEAGTFRGKYIEPGAAIFYDGQFHIFYNAFNRWPGITEVGYATSPDGITWELHPEPVFNAEIANVAYMPYTLYVSDVEVESDGTWVLYFYTWDSSLASASGVIGRATAPTPRGPWQADASPLLTPASDEGRWDSYAVRNPSVVQTDEGFVMYYAGTDISGVPVPQNDLDRIGMATSPDGLTWTKYNDPTTTEKLYALSDPVLTPQEDTIKWDGRRVDRPAVAFTPEGWVLFYRGNKGSITTGNQVAYGYALSDDGIQWTPYAQNPVVRPSLFKVSEIYATQMIYANGMYYVFAEGGTGNITQVYLAVGTLAPTP